LLGFSKSSFQVYNVERGKIAPWSKLLSLSLSNSLRGTKEQIQGLTWIKSNPSDIGERNIGLLWGSDWVIHLDFDAVQRVWEGQSNSALGKRIRDEDTPTVVTKKFKSIVMFEEIEDGEILCVERGGFLMGLESGVGPWVKTGVYGGGR
jgi:hypothetical protein